MSEEIEAIADLIDEAFAEEPSSDEGDERTSNGPGLRLGLLVGLIAGAVVATLFAPPTGEETPQDQTAEGAAEDNAGPMTSGDENTPIARVTSLIEQVRARVREASREAAIATRETEELAQARLAELTHQDAKKA